MEDIEDRLDDEDVGDEEDIEDLEAAEEPTGEAAEDEEGEGDVESIHEILVKQEAKAGEEEVEESLLELTREERLEPLAVKVVPPQAHEFVCKKCHLVKHRSQLKDKTRMLCRDCA